MRKGRRAPMARNSTSFKPSRLVAVLLIAIALVGTVIWLVVRMGMDLNAAAASVTVGLALVGLGYWYLGRRVESNRRVNDRTNVVEPILETYRTTHNKSRLLREYDEWARGDHDFEVQDQFLMDVITLLVKDGHNFEARMRLDELDELACTDEQRAEARRFRAVVEERIRINKERGVHARGEAPEEPAAR